MISNPTLFGHQDLSSSIDENDGSSDVAQNNPDSNPVTARFVVAKKGMNVILECHDHDVVTTLQQSSEGGSTKATVKDGKNYVWRKEGGMIIRCLYMLCPSISKIRIRCWKFQQEFMCTF